MENDYPTGSIVNVSSTNKQLVGVVDKYGEPTTKEKELFMILEDVWKNRIPVRVAGLDYRLWCIPDVVELVD